MPNGWWNLGQMQGSPPPSNRNYTKPKLFQTHTAKHYTKLPTTPGMETLQKQKHQNDICTIKEWSL